MRPREHQTEGGLFSVKIRIYSFVSYHTPTTCKKDTSQNDVFVPGRNEPWLWRCQPQRESHTRACCWVPVHHLARVAQSTEPQPLLLLGRGQCVRKVVGRVVSEGHFLLRTTGLTAWAAVRSGWTTLEFCSVLVSKSRACIPCVYAKGTCSSLSGGWGLGTNATESLQPSLQCRFMIQFQWLAIFSPSKEAILVNQVVCMYVLKTWLVLNQMDLSKTRLYWVKVRWELYVLCSQLFGKSKIRQSKKFFKELKTKDQDDNVFQKNINESICF